jgi:cobalt/nickel transport system permease protein
VIHLGTIDESATLGSSWLHRAWPVAKLVAFACVLAAVMVTWNALVLLALLLLMAAAVISARVPARFAFGLAAYPAIFAVMFAIASAPDPLVGVTIVLKALAAGLAAVTIALTTPYPQIFAPLQRLVPGIVGDALLMTYRSTFLLLDKFGRLLTAVRLRSGLSPGHPVRAAYATARAMGGLLLYSFDLSQREYDVMRLRGYERRLRVKLPSSVSPLRDAGLVGAAVLALATSVLWRVGAGTLNPYSWLVPVLPALALAGAALTSRSRS